MSLPRVFIAGVSVTPNGKFPNRSVKSLTSEAVTKALNDASASVEDIEAAWFANTRQPILEGQNTIRGQVALRPIGFSEIPIVNVENACASGSTAIAQAINFLRAGQGDVALCVGVEKMFFPDRPELVAAAFRGGTDVEELGATRQFVENLASDMILDRDPAEKKAQRSLFMDIYAAQARLHMRKFGTTENQLAAVAAKNHNHSVDNPMSQYRNRMSVDEILKDQLICWPLTRSMCAPISDGASATVLCSENGLARFDRTRAIEIRGLALVTGSDRPIDDYSNHIGRRAAMGAYKEAGITASDVDVAEVHDATSFSEILQTENLGFCMSGQGGALAESGETSIGGSIPVNTSGGLVSKGHPVGATGIAQIAELASQLRGEAGARQVKGARIAVAENGGGFQGVEEAVTTVTVLAH